MNLKQKKGLVGGIPLFCIGVFGLLIFYFIIYDLISIYCSLFLTICGLVFLVLGLIGKLPFKYTNPSLIIIAIIAYSLLGFVFFILYFINFQFFPAYLLLALVDWSLGGNYIWIFFAQKELKEIDKSITRTRVS